MKNLILILTSFTLLSCSDNKDYNDPEPVGFEGIIGSSSTDLSEIVFTLDLIVDDSLYLLTDSLFSLELYLNNREWGQFTSTPVDTTGFRSSKVNGSLVTSEQVEFLFITNDQSGLDSLNTAGDYSLALRELLSLQPGDYIAELRSVSWINSDGQLVKKPIRDLIPFQLAAGTNSLYIGHFSSSIKL